MIRATITISGRVQKAGYKDFVDETAFNLGLRGYVKNIKKDGTVKVVCEGKKETIKKFVDKIKIKQYPISVEDIKIRYSDATDEFKHFDIIREKNITEATYERMDMAARYMREMHHGLKEGQGSMLGKQDKMIEKQDETTAAIKGLDKKQDVMIKNQDKMIEKQDTTIDVLKDFRDVTNQQFTDMGDRYGSIQNELVNTRKELAKLVEHIGVLVEEHIKKKEK